MATYASLTNDQKNAIQENLATPIRAWYGQLSKLLAAGQAIGAAWNGGLSDVVNSLDNGEIIPNRSGLAGAQDISRADLINSVGYFIDMSNPANQTGGGGYNTAFHQALRVKFSGVNATIGS